MTELKELIDLFQKTLTNSTNDVEIVALYSLLDLRLDSIIEESNATIFEYSKQIQKCFTIKGEVFDIKGKLQDRLKKHDQNIKLNEHIKSLNDLYDNTFEAKDMELHGEVIDMLNWALQNKKSK